HGSVLCGERQHTREKTKCKRECGKGIRATTHRNESRRAKQFVVSGLRGYAASQLRGFAQD
ncbi:MAG: hypothetical protein WBB55_07040, partial [Anaerolineales bacterium]